MRAKGGRMGAAMRDGALTGHLEPLSPTGRLVIKIYNRCDGRVEFPNVLYHMALERVEDPTLVVDLLFDLAAHQREVAAAQRAALMHKGG